MAARHPGAVESLVKAINDAPRVALSEQYKLLDKNEEINRGRYKGAYQAAMALLKKQLKEDAEARDHNQPRRFLIGITESEWMKTLHGKTWNPEDQRLFKRTTQSSKGVLRAISAVTAVEKMIADAAVSTERFSKQVKFVERELSDMQVKQWLGRANIDGYLEGLNNLTKLPPSARIPHARDRQLDIETGGGLPELPATVEPILPPRRRPSKSLGFVTSPSSSSSRDVSRKAKGIGSDPIVRPTEPPIDIRPAEPLPKFDPKGILDRLDQHDKDIKELFELCRMLDRKIDTKADLAQLLHLQSAVDELRRVLQRGTIPPEQWELIIKRIPTIDSSIVSIELRLDNLQHSFESKIVAERKETDDKLERVRSQIKDYTAEITALRDTDAKLQAEARKLASAINTKAEMTHLNMLQAELRTLTQRVDVLTRPTPTPPAPTPPGISIEVIQEITRIEKRLSEIRDTLLTVDTRFTSLEKSLRDHVAAEIRNERESRERELTAVGEKITFYEKRIAELEKMQQALTKIMGTKANATDFFDLRSELAELRKLVEKPRPPVFPIDGPTILDITRIEKKLLEINTTLEGLNELFIEQWHRVETHVDERIKGNNSHERKITENSLEEIRLQLATYEAQIKALRETDKSLAERMSTKAEQVALETLQKVVDELRKRLPELSPIPPIPTSPKPTPEEIRELQKITSELRVEIEKLNKHYTEIRLYVDNQIAEERKKTLAAIATVTTRIDSYDEEMRKLREADAELRRQLGTKADNKDFQDYRAEKEGQLTILTAQISKLNEELALLKRKILETPPAPPIPPGPGPGIDLKDILARVETINKTLTQHDTQFRLLASQYSELRTFVTEQIRLSAEKERAETNRELEKLRGEIKILREESTRLGMDLKTKAETKNLVELEKQIKVLQDKLVAGVEPLKALKDDIMVVQTSILKINGYFDGLRTDLFAELKANRDYLQSDMELQLLHARRNLEQGIHGRMRDFEISITSAREDYWRAELARQVKEIQDRHQSTLNTAVERLRKEYEGRRDEKVVQETKNLVETLNGMGITGPRQKIHLEALKSRIHSEFNTELNRAEQRAVVEAQRNYSSQAADLENRIAKLIREENEKQLKDRFELERRAMEKTLKELEEKLRKEITDVDTRLATLGSRVGALTGRVGTLAEQVTGIDGRVTTLDGRVEATERGLGVLRGDVGRLRTDLDTLGTGLRTEIGGLRTDVTGLGTRVTGLDRRMGGAETQMKELDARLRAVEGLDLDTLREVATILRHPDTRATLGIILTQFNVVRDRAEDAHRRAEDAHRIGAAAQATATRAEIAAGGAQRTAEEALAEARAAAVRAGVMDDERVKKIITEQQTRGGPGRRM